MLKRSRIEAQPGVWADARRALFIESLGALVVADIHWGYAHSHRAVGNLLPIWGDDQIEISLRGLLADYAPREMIWVGDSIHTVNGRHAAERFLQEHAGKTAITVLAGNHDRRWERPQLKSVNRGNFFFHHGDDAAVTVPEGAIEIIGHHHPAAGIYDRAGMRMKFPALITSEKRFILPAFSPWAAGVDWSTRLLANEKLWLLAPSRVFAVRPARANARNPSQ